MLQTLIRQVSCYFAPILDFNDPAQGAKFLVASNSKVSAYASHPFQVPACTAPIKLAVSKEARV